MAATVPSTVVHDILAEPIRKADFGDFRTVSDSFLQRFETAWTTFLAQKTPQELPRSTREDYIEAIEAKVLELKNDKDKEEDELRLQLDFIAKTKRVMEEGYDRQLRAVNQMRRATHQQHTQQLELNSKVEELQKETIPWFHFHEELNNIAVSRDEPASDTEELNRNPKPSSRAMLLTKSTSQAYKVDHAILNTHMNMLRKEIERVESAALVQKHIGSLLTELNAHQAIGDSASAVSSKQILTTQSVS